MGANTQRFGHATLSGRAGEVAHRQRRSSETAQSASELVLCNQLRDQRLALISYGLRSSLGALRAAANLLDERHTILDLQQTSTGSNTNARLLIEGQLAQMNRLVDALLEEVLDTPSH